MSKIMNYFKELTHGKYKIAVGTLSDVNALSTLAYDISPKCSHDSWFFEKCAKNTNGHTVIVARSGKDMVGFLAYRVDRLGNIEILDVGIRPDKQRQGLGLALVNVLFLDDKNKEITATVNEYNVLAQKFLKKCGLHYYKTIKESFGPNTDGYVFRYLKE